MAMTERTRTAIGKFHDFVGNNSFTVSYLQQNMTEISTDTFFKWAHLEKELVVSRTTYTKEEMLDFVNGLSGEDCYGCYWHFALDDDGNFYTEDKYYKYRFID